MAYNMQSNWYAEAPVLEWETEQPCDAPNYSDLEVPFPIERQEWAPSRQSKRSTFAQPRLETAASAAPSQQWAHSRDDSAVSTEQLSNSRDDSAVSTEQVEIDAKKVIRVDNKTLQHLLAAATAATVALFCLVLKRVIEKKLEGELESVEPREKRDIIKGDIVFCKDVGDWYAHGGVYTGNGEVMLLKPNGAVVKVGIDILLKENRVSEVYRPKSGIDEQKFDEKVKDAMNSRPGYNVMTNNSTHFALGIIGKQNCYAIFVLKFLLALYVKTTDVIDKMKEAHRVLRPLLNSENREETIKEAQNILNEIGIKLNNLNAEISKMSQIDSYPALIKQLVLYAQETKDCPKESFCVVQ